MSHDHDIPRRCCVDRMTPAELAITRAMELVEEAGCHSRLTDAVILLQDARDAVADYVDSEIEAGRLAPEAGSEDTEAPRAPSQFAAKMSPLVEQAIARAVAEQPGCEPLTTALDMLQGIEPSAEGAVRVLLRHVGQDPGRPGLIDTPRRVAKALREMTEGYNQDPGEILSTVFEAEYDQMVVLADIPFSSLCEHHLLPFIGTASVGYLPDDSVVGLSKLARLVNCFAHRLQLQEQMTTQIAEALMSHLAPKGAGCIVRARHQCMACRGVRIAGATMVTSALLGEMREDGPRAEFLRLCDGG